MDFSDLAISGQQYRIGRMPTMTQFHVARRLAPLITTLGISVSELAQKGRSIKQDDALFEMLGPVTEVMAKMPEADVNYIITASMDAVTRAQADGRYAPVQRAGQLMFNDIDMPTMIRLTIEVLRENLAGFFPGLPGVSNTPNASGAGPTPN